MDHRAPGAGLPDLDHKGTLTTAHFDQEAIRPLGHWDHQAPRPLGTWAIRAPKLLGTQDTGHLGCWAPRSSGTLTSGCWDGWVAKV